ncbi:MAG: YdiU family protein [Deltaproteobacteria bacterium]|nr:MAG: YdiU family protein [Deltaproteobacteria bacterium]
MKFEAAYKGLVEDPNTSNLPRQAPGVHYVPTKPTPVKDPSLLCWSDDLALQMGLEKSEDLIQALSGNKLLDGMKPVSTRYGGHQFGNWAGQLGDGRAITLGNVQSGQNSFEVQLKGAGLTPFSRTADGRAVLRSSLREYICSEAMYWLGVPTTRALSLVTTGETVVRDMFYDGNPEEEPGAICTRVAPSFLRFGHYQIHYAMNEVKELEKLIEFTLENYFPGDSLEECFEKVVQRTAYLMTEWLRVGFVHGVMNTDNMSMLGLTIDYGPYGWLDNFDFNWTPNTTDFRNRRYAFGGQPNIAYWNLARLAEALSPISKDLEPILEKYPSYFDFYFKEMERKKLGLKSFNKDLSDGLYGLLFQLQGDMTLVFRKLVKVLQEEKIEWSECFYNELGEVEKKKITSWIHHWLKELESQGQTVDGAIKLLRETNPVFIPRNYIVQESIEALIQGDEAPLRKLEKAIRHPYEWISETREYFVKRPDWAKNKPGCSTLSCSS